MRVIYSGNLALLFYPEKAKALNVCVIFKLPYLSVADIQISLLFEENVIFCPGTTNSLK